MSAESIAQCKLALPMPELWHKLGLRGEPKRSCLSPFRDEQHESFSVFNNGKLWFFRDHATGGAGDEIDLIVMHSGCEKKDAIKLYHEMAGVTFAERKVTRHDSTLGKLVRIYDYDDCDESDRIVLKHQTLRFEPKRFLQRRPAVEGMHAAGKMAKYDKRSGKWWIWTLEGIEPVLFRKSKLLKSAVDEIVFICEGEKDVEAMESYGLLATTAPMGAGKWRASYTPTFKGRDVVICPDPDDPGRRHGEMVAAALFGVAKRVRIFEAEMDMAALVAA